MQVIPVQAVQRGFGQTSRRDAWWAVPLGVFLGLSSFLVYTTWAMFQANHYEFGPYLSPLYSPVFWGDSPHAWFGARPPFWPGFIPFSPALLILPFPGSFRFTCYYYRGAYYKAFWADPPSCSVGEPRTNYRGENSLPLTLQNIHRYTFYIATLFIFMLSWDAWKAMWFTDNGVTGFGIGVGTIVLVVNVVLLGGYTFGCHAARHLVGGFKDEISKSPACELAYSCTTSLNYKHQLFAWCSLFWVGFTDLYIRLCSMGIWTDLRIL
jgi:hypothetical protein